MSEAGARRLIEPHLWAGEELLWCEQPLAAGPVTMAAMRKGFYGSVGAAVGVFIFALYARGAFRAVDPRTDTVMLIASVVIAGLVLAFGALVAWSRARQLVHLVAYGVSNRRIIMVQGEEAQWTSVRELEHVSLDGSDVVVRRGRTATEQLWADQGERGHGIARAEVVAREVTLAAVPSPAQVMSLIQTLIRPSAS
jgi:hypothetical protein